MAGKFVIKKTNEKFIFNLKSGNSKIILTSETYKEKAGAQNGIASVKKNAVDDKNYDRLTSKSGQPYFVLKAGNGEIIGTSEMYSSNAAMENGIASVKENAPAAVIDDQA
jgi:uncharacterized protein YegP (UPF0339 family)